MPVRFAEKHDSSKVLVPILDSDCGNLTLGVFDQAGANWALLTISRTGRLYRHMGLPKSLGLELDEDGRIELVDYAMMPEDFCFCEGCDCDCSN